MPPRKRSTSKPSKNIRKAILDARASVAQLVQQNANEAETRRRVERIFESVMGFDAFKHLTREHAVRGAGETEHVDFAIRADADCVPMILVELKRIGEDLARKHLKQVSSYAINTGCEWLILTNGRQWSLHHVSFGQPPDTKLIEEWDLLEDDVKKLIDRFELISLQSFRRGLLDQLWQKRKALAPRHMLQAILSDKSIGYLRRELKRSADVSLTVEDVLSAVRHLLNENAAAALEQVTIRFPEQKRKRSKNPRTPNANDSKRTSLLDLIQQGTLKAPLPLFAEYKDRRFEATLLADGQIEFQKKKYPNPSKAGSAAKAIVLGRTISSSGWDFWQFKDGDGTERTLDFARSSHCAKLRLCRFHDE